MAGSPGGSGRPGRVTVPTPWSRTEAHARAGRDPANGDQDQRAMGDVRIVAGVLDDAGGRRIRLATRDGQRERRLLAARQGDRHRVEEFARQECVECGLRRTGGARARRPAPSQGRLLLSHGLAYSRARDLVT